MIRTQRLARVAMHGMVNYYLYAHTTPPVVSPLAEFTLMDARPSEMRSLFNTLLGVIRLCFGYNGMWL